MKDIFETIILSKQSLEYTCSAYEQFTKTSTFPQTYAFCLQNTDIPTSIQQAYESSKILLELLEFSLKIIPSDISPERYSQMTDVFAMHKWCGVSVVKCAQVCCVEKTVAYIEKEREFLKSGLMQAGCQVFPGKANFLLIYSKQPLYNKLLEKGILIRDCANFRGLSKGFYRIAVKCKKENEALLRAIGEIKWN